jgi:hypothetical protein
MTIVVDSILVFRKGDAHCFAQLFKNAAGFVTIQLKNQQLFRLILIEWQRKSVSGIYGQFFHQIG